MAKKYATEEERKAAHKEAKKKWYQANKERAAEYYQANKERIAARKAEWYQENKEKIAEQQAEYRKANKEKIAEHKAEYYQANKEEIAAQKAEWYQENKERKAEYNAEYYATPIGRAVNLLNAYRREDKKYNRGECTLTAQWIVENQIGEKLDVIELITQNHTQKITLFLVAVSVISRGTQWNIMSLKS